MEFTIWQLYYTRFVSYVFLRRGNSIYGYLLTYSTYAIQFKLKYNYFFANFLRCKPCQFYIQLYM